MKAAVVTPGQAGSVRLADVPKPQPKPGEVLVRVYEVGIDGTDAEILEGQYGEAPPGDDYLIIGHESLGRVESISDGVKELAPGEWVVAMVRRPDPVPCRNCAAAEWDMCLNGLYAERGIKGLHGFLAEYYAEQPRYLVKLPEELARVGVLLEPLTIAEKALDQIQRIQSRLVWEPERAVILGAGPVGLLAALLLRLQDLEVHVYDRTKPGLKSELAEAMGAQYIWAEKRRLDHKLADEIGPIDIIFEATGYSPLAFDAMDTVAPNGIVCLSGVSGGGRTIQVSADHLNLELVLGNRVVFGTVNANRRHFEAGAKHLSEIEARWPGLLTRIITTRIPMERFAEGVQRRPGDVKTVVEVLPMASSAAPS